MKTNCIDTNKKNSNKNIKIIKKVKQKKRVKKQKKVKLTSIRTITNRLYRLVSLICRENANFTCEICGLKKGEKHPITNKPQNVEAHHIMSRSNANSLLKFDTRNLICLCSTCHKHGQFSAHKHAVWFAEWLRINKPKQYEWVLLHSNDVANLKDRLVLELLETGLINQTNLNWDNEQKSLIDELNLPRIN